jgi:hypothetical protein
MYEEKKTMFYLALVPSSLGHSFTFCRFYRYPGSIRQQYLHRIENNNYETLTDADHEQHPSQRVGKPEDIARTCLFLCQPENNFINAENIVIDGGMTKKMIYI